MINWFGYEREGGERIFLVIVEVWSVKWLLIVDFIVRSRVELGIFEVRDLVIIFIVLGWEVRYVVLFWCGFVRREMLSFIKSLGFE